jgi:hypothetical protein
MPKRLAQADDSQSFYNRFMASDVKNKKKLKDEILYQLYKKIQKEPKDIAPQILDPEDHEPNQIHQADILYMPDDEGYKYALTVVDTGSRLTDVEPLKERKATDALDAIQRIYKRGILKRPELSIEVDSGTEFKGEFKKYFEDAGLFVRVAQSGRSRQQGLVENRNGLIGRTLMRRMVAEELLTKEKSVEWLEYLPKIIKLMNQTYQLKQIKNMKPAVIMADVKTNKASTDLLEEGQEVRYQLDKPVDTLNHKRLHGGFREGDVRWSVKPVKILRIQMVPNQPVFYKLQGLTALYTKPQIQPVSAESKLPPASVQIKFIIEKLVGRKETKAGSVSFKVRWQGYEPKDDTWKKREDLMKEVPHIVEGYEKANKVKLAPKTPKKK